MLRRQAIHDERSIEYQWCEEIRKVLNAQLVELSKGSCESGWPDHLENAIGNLASAIDDISRRMDELDENS